MYLCIWERESVSYIKANPLIWQLKISTNDVNRTLTSKSYDDVILWTTYNIQHNKGLLSKQPYTEVVMIMFNTGKKLTPGFWVKIWLWKDRVTVLQFSNVCIKRCRNLAACMFNMIHWSIMVIKTKQPSIMWV